MKRALLALTLAASALLPAVASAECLPSSAAVFAAHPDARHASWEGRSHPGRRCWFAGYPGDSNTARPDGDMRRAAGLADGRHARGSGAEQPATATNSTPLPRQRPASAPPAMAAPSAPVEVATADPLREAMERYVVEKYLMLMERAGR